MRSLLALATLVPNLALAQPGATPIQAAPESTAGVTWLARGAHDAAVRGDCKQAYDLGLRVARMDVEYYRAVIATDATMTACAYTPPASSPVEVRTELPGKPSEASGGSIAGEILLGGLLSIGGGLGGAFLGALVSDGNCSDECWGNLLIGGAVGLAVGATAGVLAVGARDDIDYSIGATFGGALIGSVVGFGIAASGEGEVGTVLALVAAPTIGAVLGFNLSRRQAPSRAYARGVAPPPPRIADHSTVISLGQIEF